MVKYLIFFLISLPLWGKPAILVSYYDAFSRHPFNNSERVALELAKTLNDGSHPFHVVLCPLNTVFDRSFQQLSTCYAQTENVMMVLGLGEGNCNLKIETMVRNLDRTLGPDNAGTERAGTVIIPNAPKVVGLTYPLAEMYCALGPKARKKVQVSNSAGSFVCNNTAFQFAQAFPTVASGFIHVPNNGCFGLSEKNEKVVRKLSAMVIRAQEILGQGQALRPLPLTVQEIRERQREVQGSPCFEEFYQRTEVSEKNGFWNILFTN